MSVTLLHLPRPSARTREGYAATTPARDRSGVRAPMLLVASFAVAAPVAVLVAAVGGAHAPVTALVLLGVAAFAVGWAAEPVSAVVVGLVFWLFFDGFDADRWGVLGLHGHDAVPGLLVLVAAGVLASLLGAWSRAAQGSKR